MERQQIEVFLALAEELHFGRTAERLRLSQARVSQSVKLTEAEIGAPLFFRTSRSVALTPVGEQLRDSLAPAYAGVLDAVAAAASKARSAAGPIAVCFLGPLAGDLVSRVADRFPHEARLRATEVADPLRPLRDGEVDLLLTQLPVGEPGMTSGRPLIEEPRVLALAADHPLATRPSVSLEDLAGERIPLPAGQPSRDWEQAYQPWTTPSGRPIERGPSVATFSELLSLIAAGQGACTVAAHNTTYNARPGIAYVPIHDAPPFRFGLVWRTGFETPLSRAFVKEAERLVEALGGPAQVASRLAGEA